MYIEHPYFYEGKYYANIDGEMIEVTKEVAYAMNNFYRSSKAKKVEIKNELGEVVDKMLREVPYSSQSIDGEGKAGKENHTMREGRLGYNCENGR